MRNAAIIMRKAWYFLIAATLVWVLMLISVPGDAGAFGECDQYGVMSLFDPISNSCKCMSGYVFSDDYYGNSTCKLGSSVCQEKYGLFTTYNSYSKSCECSYGYTFGKGILGETQCVSRDSLCRDQLGINSRYNSAFDKCECSYGYVIDGGKCTDGDLVCRSRHGYRSSFDESISRCECDIGYTFNDSNQCVEKQNNVYFTLRELDTDDRKAIIRSDYDSRDYIVGYGYGCNSTSFRRYLGGSIVVNLGTDFDLEVWDKIVLPDEHEVCAITDVERANLSSTLFEEVEETNFLPVFSPSPINPLAPVPAPKVVPPQSTPTPNKSLTPNPTPQRATIDFRSMTAFATEEATGTIAAQSTSVEENKNSGPRLSWIRRMGAILLSFLGIL